MSHALHLGVITTLQSKRMELETVPCVCHLREQEALLPFHSLSFPHTLVRDPWISYPTAQENSRLLWTERLLPFIKPFSGLNSWEQNFRITVQTERTPFFFFAEKFSRMIENVQNYSAYLLFVVRRPGNGLIEKIIVCLCSIFVHHTTSTGYLGKCLLLDLTPLCVSFHMR